ncbi:hypothetical protein [Polaromonas sp.]|uniref:hypothetical protein n=1 Tax=Polaromonas sp. TaxID=1869339 RepID=UPI003267A68B
MPKALVSVKQLKFPQHGVIVGGLLDGWSYGFIRIVYLAPRICFDLRATRPKHVFPVTVRLSTADFLELANLDKALPRIDAQPLIDAAMAAGKKK